MISAIKKQMRITVSDENKGPLAREIIKANMFRGKIIALTLIVIELCVIVLRLLVSPAKIIVAPWGYYYIMYLLMIAFMAAVLIILDRASKKEKIHIKRMNAITYCCVAFVLAWNMIITLLDLSVGGHLLSYFIALVAISVIIYLKPKVLLIIYLSVHAVYLALLPFFLPSGHVAQAEYINTSIAVIISIFIGLVIYRSKVLVFIQQKTIEQKNDQLNLLNEQLTETNETLEYLSQTDGLTGIYNRRMFDEISHDYWESCIEKNAPLTVIMMDIDHFKEYNDNFGHQAGDDCLIKLVNSLKKSIGSKETMLARYGGEEFILMMCGITKKASYDLAEKIRKNVEKLDIKRKYTVVAEHILLSLGVYRGMPSKQADVKEFIEYADKALYAAKRDKRNNTKMTE
ncbi:MAG: GGDEF domain-containing protein [Clostridia bacterium]|nr:GGDEF domain-containing protein [Clostridia bacterium]